ncbi:lactocepin [Bacillus niacini]|uniref:Lactocepin n=1 Tax=Neobacillus niacini TaxID=86668 RepID=A0A852T8H4_9BACI|nr:cell wall-binding repeat-containing protein [Neobacillus niacini]NYE03754.1 lactocepin [Neobacillus niacini]
MKFKTSMSLALASLLVFSNTAMAASKPLLKPEAVKPQRDFAKSINFKNGLNNAAYKKSDKVRVIVEVEGEPAITYATKQGKKYNELSKSVKEQLQNDILKEQNAVKSKITSKSVKMQFKESFTTAVNGFSGIVEYGQIEAIKSVDGVTKVTIANEYQRPETTPEMKYSKEIVQAQNTWDDYGVKGEGMVVGIIDTGIDPSHKDMVLTDATKADLTKAEVEAAIAEKGVQGQYFTDKVPYGYNYYDENNEILDIGPDASMHGMHVAGTVGANGNEEEGGLKGVAPEAQLLALKVFGNDPEMPSTWSDIIIKAIDDAIQMDADVVNMSLGSTGAFVLPDDPEQMAVKRAVDNGVLMSISAGNSNHFGDGYFNPLSANPDKGVVGSPGLSTESLQVASLENSFIDLFAATYSYGETVGKAPFLSASSVDPNSLEQKSFEILDAGLGKPEEFAGKDFTGKIALVKRGELDFVVKALNAQAAGAAGVIVYNHSDGYVSMATSPEIKIPQLFMLKTDGELLKAQLDSGTPVTIEFQGDQVTAANPTADQMSGFTSWGVTPNLDFKPEITAPGGNILSTLNKDQYGVMSGTSMAAPHVSGGSALVLERVEKDFPSLTGAAKVNMAKNILMNTSKVVEDKGVYNNAYMHNPYSPRRQGGGLMQLHSALSTPVVVTNEATNEAKIALKEIKDNKATFTLKAQNFSSEAVTYNVSGNVLTDLVIDGVDQLESQGIYKAGTISASAPWEGEFPISFSTNQLTVPANGSASVIVTVDLNDTVEWGYNAPLDEIFENGYFVEGFVTLTDVNDKNPAVNVPYVGFNGDWNQAPIVDPSIYDENINASFYGWTGMVTSAGDDNYNYLGTNPADESASATNIAFSPNGDGASDDAMPILSFLRNAKSVEYKIVDKDGNVLRKLNSAENVRKNFNDGGTAPQYNIVTEAAWDGKVKNKLVPDGEYFYEISSTIDFEGKEPQKVTFPVVVDTVAPEVTASVTGNKLSLSSTDENGLGVAYYDILVNGKSVYGEEDLPLAGTATEYTFAKAPVGGTVEVIAYDYAGNTKKVVVEGANDDTIPYIHVTSIGATNVYTSLELPVAGYVTDDSKITDFKVAGQPVELVWNDETSRYEFSTTVTFEEDGVQEVRITGKDAAGNAIDYLVRDLVVDTTAPELKVDVPTSVKPNVDKVTLKATISDNFEELQYKVDGDEEFNHQFAFENFVMKSIEKEVSTELTLKPGNNTFTLELVDVAGNTTTKEVSIYRESAVERLAGPTRYETSVEVSKKGWEQSDVVVLARGDVYADALAGVPLAAKYDAPLLLTASNDLNKSTQAEIERLGAKKVYILGGTGAISSSVEKQLKGLGVEVVRLSGENRYETAATVAKVVAPEGSKEVVVVNGFNFPDALSVASFAGAQGLPILLVNDSKTLPAETKTAVKDLGATKTLVIGGNGVVNNEVAKKLPSVTRVGGETRYETNVAVAKHFDLDANFVYVATGDNFPDSLAGAALAAKDKTGIVLVTEALPEATKAYLASLNLVQVNVLGGENVVSASLVSKISPSQK